MNVTVMHPESHTAGQSLMPQIISSAHVPDMSGTIILHRYMYILGLYVPITIIAESNSAVSHKLHISSHRIGQ